MRPPNPAVHRTAAAGSDCGITVPAPPRPVTWAFGEGRMGPADYYRELAGLLTRAAEVVESLRDLNVYCPFDSPAEFGGRLRALAALVGGREHGALRDLVPIFAPTGAWDDEVGAEGIGLAERVTGLLDLLQWSAEPGAAADRAGCRRSHG